MLLEKLRDCLAAIVTACSCNCHFLVKFATREVSYRLLSGDGQESLKAQVYS